MIYDDMHRSKLITDVKEYFDIEELVCDHVLARWSDNEDRIWDFLDTRFLANLLVLRRDIIQQPMYCNHHKRGTHQRGLRCNLCELVKEKDRAYLSAHILGKAGDFSIEGMSAEKARQRIRLLAGALPYPIRLEKNVSWLHFDVMPLKDGQKIYEFSE